MAFNVIFHAGKIAYYGIAMAEYSGNDFSNREIFQADLLRKITIADMSYCTLNMI